MLLLSLLIAPHAALAYQSPQNHFTVTPPAQWIELPPEAIETLTKLLTKPGAQSAKFERGFKEKSNLFLKPPIVMVQFVPGTVTLDGLERSIPKLTAQPAGSAPSAVGPRTARLERDKRRAVTSFDINPPQGQPLKGVIYTILGREGMINLHCYGPAGTFDQDAKTFTAFADSFQFDPGYEYVDRHPARGLILFAVIACIVGGVIYGVRKAKKPAAPR